MFPFLQDQIFSQPARSVQHRNPTKAEKPLEETSARNIAKNSKPPTCKTAWTNQQTKEQLKKNITTDKKTRINSQRQRTYSEVENVEILYSSAQNKDTKKHVHNKNDPGLSRSESEDGLDLNDGQFKDNMLTDRSGLTAFSDGNTSTTRSKFTSREAVVKSQKPTTKPLHLGKFHIQGFLFLCVIIGCGIF